MDQVLRKSFWLEGAYRDVTPTPPLQGTRTFDVVILGGGYTGLSTAYYLKKREPGLSVAIVEEHVAGYGASGRNAGFSMTLLGENILELRRSAGLEAARVAHVWMRDCVDTLETFIRENGIDCDYERNGLLFIGFNKNHETKLRREIEVFRELGTQARFLGKDEVAAELPRTPAICAAYDPQCAILNPAKLTRAQRDIVRALGVELFEGTRVVRYEEGSTIGVVTDSGAIARAPKIVIATNAYSCRLGFQRQRVFPLFTYIILTEPLDPARLEAIGWKGRQGIETARRFVHYMRLTKDNRLLIGGGDAYYYYNYGLDHDHEPAVFDPIYREMVRLFPPLEGVGITHRWGGAIDCTFDWFPTVGVAGRHRNILYSMGYTGHGVSLSNSAGRILRDLYFGEETELTRLFFINHRPQWFPPEPLLTPSIAAYKALLKGADLLDEMSGG